VSKNRKKSIISKFVPLFSGTARDERLLLRKLKRSSRRTIDAFFAAGPEEMRGILFGRPVVRHVNDLMGSYRTTDTGDLLAELRWRILFLGEHTATVLKHLDIQGRFCRAIIAGNFLDARIALNQHRTELGLSLFWLHSAHLLAQCEGGLSANLQERKSVWDTAASGNLIRLFAWFASKRVDDTLSFSSYDREYNALVATMEGEAPIEKFVWWCRTHLHWSGISTWTHLASAVWRDECLPIPDAYESTVRVLRAVLTGKLLPMTSIEGQLRELYHAVPDTRVVNLLLAHDPESAAISRDVTLASAVEKYTAGDYAQAKECASQIIEARPDCLEAYELWTDSVIYGQLSQLSPLPEESIGSRVLGHMLSARSRVNDVESTKSLQKWALAMEFCPYGQQLNSYASRHAGAPTLPASNDYWQLCANIITPRFASLYETPQRALALLEKLSADYPLSSQLFRSTVSDVDIPHSVPRVRQLKYNGIRQEAAGQHAAAIQSYTMLLDSYPDISLACEAAIKGLARCHLALGQLQEAQMLIAKVYLQERSLLAVLPVAELLSRSADSPERDLRQTLSHPVSILARVSEGHKRGNRALFIAYDEFLSSQSVEKPSELLAKADTFEPDLFGCFLHEVCTLEVMDCSLAFRSTNELERERLKICLFLRNEFDQANAATYDDEIASLVRRETLRHALRHVAESKIFVDTEGIRASLDADFLERFDRFRAYTNVDERLRKSLAPDLRPYFRNPGNNEQPIVVALDESLQQFRGLFMELLSRFISSNEYGLDSYLSIRVRHGTLAGQLRSQFDNEGLLTQRAASGMYADNTVWGPLIVDKCGENVSRKALAILARFSDQVDKAIDYLKSQIIQIRGTGTPAGLFDFEFTAEQLLVVWLNCFAASSFEEFSAVAFNALWERTRESCVTVIDYLQSAFVRQLTALVDDLAEQLWTVAPELLHSELNTAVVRARTNVQNEIERIVAWFSPSGTGAVVSFDAGLAFDTAFATVTQCNPQTTLRLERGGATVASFSGRYFSAFVDIFQILLNNIVNHSGLSDIDGSVGLDHEGELFVISVGNVTCLSEAELISAVTKANASVFTGKTESLRKEGGTGIVKLHKLVRFDLGRASDYTLAAYAQDGRFVIRLTFPVEGIVER
jgi:hypothetical protein